MVNWFSYFSYFFPYKNGALRTLYMVKKILSQLELVFSDSISFEDYNSDYALKIQLPLGTDEYLLSLKWMRQEALSPQCLPAFPSHQDCPTSSAFSPASASILLWAWGKETIFMVIAFVSASVGAVKFIFFWRIFLRETNGFYKLMKKIINKNNEQSMNA